MERTLLAVESRPSGWWITLCGKPVDAREDKREAIDAATGLVRVTTRAGARKARNVAAGGPAARTALCQADGLRCVTLEGRATVTRDPARLAEAVRRYTDRYRTPPPDPPDLVVIEIAVDRALSLNL